MTMKKCMFILVAAAAMAGMVQADTFTVPVGTVYTNSASYLAVGTSVVVPDGAAFDLRTVRNSSWYNYRYTINIAGTGPDGKGALRDTGTHDPRGDDVQIPSLSLSADALIKSDHYMAILNSGYKTTTLQLNGHDLTLDFATGKRFTLFSSGPWNTTGNIKLINGILAVPTSKEGTNYHISDFELATAIIDGPNSQLNVNGDGAVVYFRNVVMTNSATLAGNGWVGINGGTFKPSETNSAFTGTLRIWGNIALDLSGLDGAWKWPKHDFYKCTSSTVTLKLAPWATTGNGGKKLINWTEQPASVTFKLESAVAANWRMVNRIDGLYLYPMDFPFYVVRDLGTSSWRFYKYDWTEVTGTCGLSAPTAEQTVCFSSVAEYEALKQLTFDAREVQMRSCTLGADAALTEMPFVIAADATVDVAGHKLTIPGSVVASSVGGTITSSAAGGVLAVNVPQGETNRAIYTAITGGANLQLWKTGAGRLSLERAGQSFGANGTVACLVKEGVLAKKDASGTFFGAQYSTIKVESGAQVDVMGGGYWDYDYHIAGSGPDGKGAMVCGVNKTGHYVASKTYAHLRSLVLDDDAAVGGDIMWSLNFYNNESHTITFNGHTLTVGADNFVYWIALNPQDSGKLVVGSMEIYQASVDFSNIDVEVLSCLASNSGNFLKPVKSLKYAPTARWYQSGATANDGTATVLETYRPSRLDVGSTPPVMLGAAGHLTPTLDLSTQLDVLDGSKLSFAEGAKVTVATGTRQLANEMKLISWSEKPADSVAFVPQSDKQSVWRFAVREDGLYLYTGLVIYIR